MDLFGVRSQQEAKVPENHQALDVVCVTPVEGLVKRGSQAGQRGLGIPVEGGKGFCRLKSVALDIGGHASPVNMAHELSPPENLAHESLHGVEGCRS